MHVYLISFIIKQHINSKYVIFRPFCEQSKKNESVSFIIY
ncbi:GTP pyrophosphokinase [Bacillus cereus]|nr:GTP pyrophosphokinase [Bacillus cereus]